MQHHSKVLQSGANSGSASRPLPRHAPAPVRQQAPVRHLVVTGAASGNGDSENKPVSLEERIASGQYTDSGSTKEKLTRPVRQLLAKDPLGIGRLVSLQLAKLGRQWRADASKRMPEARGDIREIVGQPVFVPLYQLFKVYGKIFALSFGPKRFVIISDPAYAKQILMTNADKYSKGLLSEILDFVMGKGLIPADGEVWKVRRRAIVPALHRKYVQSMVGMFGDCTFHGLPTLDKAITSGQPIDMENYFSRLALDIIGKAVFNYDFDSLTHDDPVIQAVYTTLREAEHRSTAPIAYWDLPGAKLLVPRQRRCQEALKVVNETLDGLIDKCKKLVEEEDMEFNEEFLSDRDPSILHFLIASGDDITSKQLRDDLMTMLIAGHETTAAVLTWTMYLLAQHPEAAQRIRDEVDAVIGDRAPTIEDMKALKYTTRVINESMRLYPQPPVLIRRALQDDTFDNYTVTAGSDIFISVWNLHRSPSLWDEPEKFKPERFGPLDGPIPNEITTDFAYLPFGGGRRKCIGDQFALLESLVGLSMLMRRYEFELDTSKGPVGMTTGATIHTTSGLNMRIKRRDTSKLPTPPPAQPMHAPASAAAGGCPMHAALVEASAAANGCPMHSSNGASNGASASNGNGNGNGAHSNGVVVSAGPGVSVSMGNGVSIGGTPASAPAGREAVTRQ